jgi:hypothetical protein
VLLVRPSSAVVVATIIVIALAACGGGGDEGTTSGPAEGAAEGSSANLSGRLDGVLLRLRQRGFDVRATSPRQPHTPRSRWPKDALRVETRSGPLTIYAYRSQRVVKELLNPRRDYGLAFRGYRTWWSSGPAGDELGGCGKYVYFGHNANMTRALRVADLCRGEKTQFAVVA